MPELSLEAARQFWLKYEDPTVYRVISFLESAESWSLDGDPSLEASLAALGHELDDIQSIDFDALEQQSTFVKIAAYLKTSRGLRLLQVLDATHPGAASKVLAYAENNADDAESAAAFFLRRNIAFERMRLLPRIFSSERLSLVMRALEGGNDHD